MGKFDTFWGNYRCGNCGQSNNFKSKTKEFSNCLLEFYTGDYIDVSSRNCYYRFEHNCPKCKHENRLAIVVRNGQYVDVIDANTADNTDIQRFKNIEDGYQRNINYRIKCKKMLGEDERIHDSKLWGLRAGDTIRVLEHDWIVDDIFYERDKDKQMPMFFEHKCFVIPVHWDTHKRMMVISYNESLKEYKVCLHKEYALYEDLYLWEKCQVVYAKFLDKAKMYKAFNVGDLVWFSDPFFGDMKCVITSVKERADGVFYDVSCGEYTAENIKKFYLHKRNQ